MKTLLTAIIAFVICPVILFAQDYPITSPEALQKLVVEPDMDKIKVLIFNDNYVKADVFLYFAIVRGLANDGVPTSIAHSVAKETQGDNFVPKCKICESTRKAFSAYAEHGTTYSTETNPSPDLASNEAPLRHDAIKKAIDKYTSSFLTLLNLSAIEMEQLQSTLAKLRKQGMAGLNSSFGSKSCPSCDGATHED